MRVFLAVALLFFTISQAHAGWFSDPKSDVNDMKAVQQQQAHYSIAQPVPKFDWSLERDLVIQLYKARNTEVATHTVWRSNTGLIEGDCPSIGFGLPYDTSLTNPLAPTDVNQNGRQQSSGALVTVEQPEPNGVFASKNSSATWVMCVVKEGNKVSTVPVYIESKVTVYPMPVSVDYSTNRVRMDGGKASVTINSRKK